MGHIVMSLVILLFGVVLFANSFGFPEIQGGSIQDAGAWPRIVAALLIFFTCLALYEDYKNWKREKALPESERPDPTKAEGYDPKGRRRMLGAVTLMLLYMVFGLKYLGFIASSLVFIPLFMYLLGNRKPIVIILNTLAVTILCYLLFCKFMMIPLPRGMGIFRSFSLLFY
ncbi:MAG: tripartite tricarboxylate transporter TctB family protein [Candidatus Heteroscillospira sp.]|jgi:putative tricarboxylic transport membrane protein